MNAYYNEHDPFAAAWLRKLIGAGLVAPGEVDERSILDVTPVDLAGFTQCHFFAGIGVWSYALRNAGWPDDSPVWTGSCPCQSFSQSGKRGGFGDPRHLWPAWFRLIRECRPDAVFGEQVASRDGLAWLDVVCADLEGEGYAVGAADLCAAGFGAPHIRQRLYFVAESASARRDGAREYGCGLSPFPARSEQRIEALSLADTMRTGGREIGRGASGDEEADGRAGRLILEPNGDHVAASHGEAGLVADAEQPESCDGGLQRGGQFGQPAEDDGAGRELGHADEPRSQGQPELAGTGRSELLAGAPSPADGMGDSGVSGAARLGEHGGTPEGAEGREIREYGGPSPTNGFWRNAEWLPCRDGKSRPVEPGVAPLVAGAPNRVGRLRGYGNALCAPVAEGFVRAYMETIR